jgi:hypothetical protein
MTPTDIQMIAAILTTIGITAAVLALRAGPLGAAFALGRSGADIVHLEPDRMRVLADRESGRGFNQGRIVCRGNGYRVDDRARDRIGRRRNNSAAELAHNLAAAQRDLHAFGKRQVPDLVIISVFKR